MSKFGISVPDSPESCLKVFSSLNGTGKLASDPSLSSEALRNKSRFKKRMSFDAWPPEI